MQNDRDLETIPVGALGLINLNGCEALGQKINNYIVDWRNERENEHKTTVAFATAECRVTDRSYTTIGRYNARFTTYY